jgi:two-component system chemotaxis response regulator CheY
MSPVSDTGERIPSFDSQSLLARLSGRKEIARKIVSVFLRDTRNRLRLMREALADADLGQARFHAQSLKGASCDVSAARLAACAGKLANATPSDATPALSLLADMEREFEEFRLAAIQGGFDQGTGQSGLRSLAVDDDATSRCLLQGLLEEYGPCDSAGDGLAAMRVFEQAIHDGWPYTLLCLDIQMPNLDGQGVLDQVRKTEFQRGIWGKAGVKILMTTSLNDPKNILQSFRQQCDGYIVKPVGHEKLRNQIESLGLIQPAQAVGRE